MHLHRLIRFHLLLATLFVAALYLTSVGLLPSCIFSLLAIGVLILLPGFDSALIITTWLRKPLSFLETFTLGCCLSLGVAPFLLTIEYELSGILSPLLPLVNTFIVAIVALLSIYWTQQKQSFPENKRNNFKTFSLTEIRSVLQSPLLWLATTGFLIFLFATTLAFPVLPDLDPYYWLTMLRDTFSAQQLTLLAGYRPLFASLAYIFTQSAHIDFFLFFKYILPGTFLLLLPALFLLARQFPHPLQRTVIFLFPFINGVTLLYLTEPVPQAILSVYLLFSVIFLAHTHLAHRRDFLFFSGIPLFFGFFFHEVGILPLSAWIVVMFFLFYRTLWKTVSSHPFTTLIFILWAFPLIQIPFRFFSTFRGTYLSLLHGFHFNFLFPMKYTNVDGNAMGWGTPLGVIKYYAFYAGPVIGLLAIIGTVFLFRHRYTLRKFISQIPAEIWAALLPLAGFFAIAEIIPRLWSMALLPDRAWTFIGIYALFFLMLVLASSIGRDRRLLWTFVIAFGLSIGGFLYINLQKQYVITPTQLASAEWITAHLPKDRVIFSTGNQPLLSFYANSKAVSVPDPHFYTDASVIDQALDNYQQQDNIFRHNYQARLNQVTNELSAAAESFSPDNKSATIISINRSVQSLVAIQNDLRTEQPLQKPGNHRYIYYAAPDPRNPYNGRPYLTPSTTADAFVFDQCPEKFQRLYADPDHHIYLWEIL